MRVGQFGVIVSRRTERALSALSPPPRKQRAQRLIAPPSDPLAEHRIETFNRTLGEIRRLEPGNSHLQYVAPPNYVPSTRILNRTVEELEAARDRVSSQIGLHAFQQGHGDRYFAGAGEFELSGIARRVIGNPASVRVDLPRNRTGYYEARSGTVVIVEPDITGGTMIRRSDGLQFLQRLKRR